MHHVGHVRVDSEFVQVKCHPARLGVDVIEVDDDDDHVVAIVARARLRIRNEMVVVNGVEDQSVVELQCGVLAADGVHHRDETREVRWVLEVPRANFVLL